MSSDPSGSSSRQRLKSLFHRRGKDRSTSDVQLARTQASRLAEAHSEAPIGTFIEHWMVLTGEGAAYSLHCYIDCSIPSGIISLDETESIVNRGRLIEQHMRTKSISSVEEHVRRVAGWRESGLVSLTQREGIKSAIEEEAERWRERRNGQACLLGDIVFSMADRPVIDWKNESVETDERGVITSVAELTMSEDRRG